MAKSSVAKTGRSGPEQTGQLRLRLYDGSREPIAADRKYLVRILDGRQTELLSKDLKGPEKLFDVPFHDNLDDRYCVLVSAKDCADTGFYPVIVTQDIPAVVDLMLVPKSPEFDFAEADWDRVKANRPGAFAALSYGAPAKNARARYDELLKKPRQAATLWNILTSMRDAHLPQGCPIDYLREIIWDGDLAPNDDRFFGFASLELLRQLQIATHQGAFAIEPNPAMFHKDATSSFKQVAFGEANLQITFHEGSTKRVEGDTWVRIEPDIDYYKDLTAHALLEVIPHRLTGSKTDPAAVYVLRWIAGRHAGLAEFNPPYELA
jgi:hypothetical protein